MEEMAAPMMPHFLMKRRLRRMFVAVAVNQPVATILGKPVEIKYITWTVSRA